MGAPPIEPAGFGGNFGGSPWGRPSKDLVGLACVIGTAVGLLVAAVYWWYLEDTEE